MNKHGEIVIRTKVPSCTSLSASHTGEITTSLVKGCENCYTACRPDEDVVYYCKEHIGILEAAPETAKQRDDLLVACERHKKVFINNYGNTSWMANHADMEAAIAKCKKD